MCDTVISMLQFSITITWKVHCLFVSLLAMAPLPHFPQGTLPGPVTSDAYGVPTSLDKYTSCCEVKIQTGVHSLLIMLFCSA